MGKTLYVQIDNNSLPKGCGEDVEVLDCRCINDFCSLVGDALVGDLKDENGKSLYRLINPVGRLVRDFEKANKTCFDQILTQWMDILGEILHYDISLCKNYYCVKYPKEHIDSIIQSGHISNSDTMILLKPILEEKLTEYKEYEFPLLQQYVDWLMLRENFNYNIIGERIKSNHYKVSLATEELYEQIVSIVHKIIFAIDLYGQSIEQIVFSNNRITNSSKIARIIKEKRPVNIMQHEIWCNMVLEEKIMMVNTLNNLHSLSNFIQTIKCEESVQGTWIQKNWLEFDGLECKRLYINREALNKDINHLLNILCESRDIDFKNVDMSSIASLLSSHGFSVVSYPFKEFSYSGITYYWKAEFSKRIVGCKCHIMLKTDWKASIDTKDLIYTIDIVLK